MFCAATALVALARILSACALSAAAFFSALSRSRRRRRSSVSRWLQIQVPAHRVLVDLAPVRVEVEHLGHHRAHEVHIVGDHDEAARVRRRGTGAATRSSPRRGGWLARRATGSLRRRTGCAQARRACAGHRTACRSAGRGRGRRAPGSRRCARRRTRPRSRRPHGTAPRAWGSAPWPCREQRRPALAIACSASRILAHHAAKVASFEDAVQRELIAGRPCAGLAASSRSCPCATPCRTSAAASPASILVKRGLARAVAANEAHPVARADREGGRGAAERARQSAAPRRWPQSPGSPRLTARVFVDVPQRLCGLEALGASILCGDGNVSPSIIPGRITVRFRCHLTGHQHRARRRVRWLHRRVDAVGRHRAGGRRAHHAADVRGAARWRRAWAVARGARRSSSTSFSAPRDCRSSPGTPRARSLGRAPPRASWSGSFPRRS